MIASYPIGPENIEYTHFLAGLTERTNNTLAPDCHSSGKVFQAYIERNPAITYGLSWPNIANKTFAFILSYRELTAKVLPQILQSNMIQPRCFQNDSMNPEDHCWRVWFAGSRMRKHPEAAGMLFMFLHQ